MSDLPEIGSTWRHKKSGGIYEIVGHCLVEATLEPAVVYHGGHGFVLDGTIWTTWCRPVAEFMDGRFEPAPPPHPAPAHEGERRR